MVCWSAPAGCPSRQLVVDRRYFRDAARRVTPAFLVKNQGQHFHS